MHVTAASVQIQPEKMQEGIDIHNGAALAAVKAQKGFRARS